MNEQVTQMILSVQDHIRKHGLDFGDLGIKIGDYGDFVILNYNQIESPKTGPIVRECRALVLRKETWEVVSWPFKRFFNQGEALDITGNFDFSHGVVLEKLDGSIIGLFHDGAEWRIHTRSVLDGDNQVGDYPVTFAQMFESVVDDQFWDNLDEKFSYAFELTGPENRIVTPYEERDIALIGMRNRTNLRECGWEALVQTACALGVKLPKVYNMNDLTSILNMARELGTMEEGFVCVDYTSYEDGYNHPRLKVKNPSYVAMAHLKESSSSSLTGLMVLVMSNEQDEFLSYFPEYGKQVGELLEHYSAWKREFLESFASVSDHIGEEKTPENRKNFALKVKDTPFSGMLFEIYNGKAENPDDAIEKQKNKNGDKNFAKKLLQKFGYKVSNEED